MSSSGGVLGGSVVNQVVSSGGGVTSGQVSNSGIINTGVIGIAGSGLGLGGGGQTVTVAQVVGVNGTGGIGSGGSIDGQDDMDKVLTSYFDKTVNSNTIKEKPTPSSELSKGDLLKILSYLEGEVQARDVVIATLKCERVKRLLADNKYSLNSDPFSALKRDNFASYVSNNDSKEDIELVRLWETQKLSLENLVRKQRAAMKHLQKVLSDAELMHRKMAVELEEEKEKNVRTKEGRELKEELDIERQLRARMEKELKDTLELEEEEKQRHKNIVLLLLTERKRILKQFVEERKRSADLSAMLEEEKRQALNMAEGLEEESQKALRMEAELERQLLNWRVEKERMQGRLRAEEERRVEVEHQLKILRNEAEGLRKQLAEAHSVAMFQAGIVNSSQQQQQAGGGTGGTATPQGVQGGTMILKKNQQSVLRPTATVSSVPVPQPTTGIAKPVTQGQQMAANPSMVSGGAGGVIVSAQQAAAHVSTSILHQTGKSGVTSMLGGSSSAAGSHHSAISGTLSSSPSATCITPSVTNSSSSSAAGGVSTLLAGSNVGGSSSSSSGAPKKYSLGRGVPPPIPPNKPSVPPKSGSLTAKIHAAKLEQQIT